MVAEPAEGMTPIERAPEGSRPRYVLNRGTGLAHKVHGEWAATQPMAGWRAACGWAFSGANALLVIAQPQRPWCTHCFKGAPPPTGWRRQRGLCWLAARSMGEVGRYAASEVYPSTARGAHTPRTWAASVSQQRSPSMPSSSPHHRVALLGLVGRGGSPWGAHLPGLSVLWPLGQNSHVHFRSVHRHGPVHKVAC